MSGEESGGTRPQPSVRPQRMTNLQLIRALREKAQVEQPGSLCALLNAAADRIETLDERVAIITEAYR